MDVKPEQFSNALLPILMTLLGIFTEVSLFIPEQMEAGITSTSSPNVNVFTLLPKLYPLQFLAFHTTEIILEQLEKAVLFMLVTLLPIVTEVKLLQLAKALLPILLTLLPIVTEVKLLQSEKAVVPIPITLFPIVTEVKLLQPEKALFPMLMTLLGISMEIKPVQSAKAE